MRRRGWRQKCTRQQWPALAAGRRIYTYRSEYNIDSRRWMPAHNDWLLGARRRVYSTRQSNTFTGACAGRRPYIVLQPIHCNVADFYRGLLHEYWASKTHDSFLCDFRQRHCQHPLRFPLRNRKKGTARPSSMSRITLASFGCSRSAYEQWTRCTNHRCKR